MQQFQALRAVPVQHVALAVAPRTCVSKLTALSKTKGESFPECGARCSAAHICCLRMQQFQAWRAVPVQHVALA
eukprot:9501578-Pyramimonas_sp.AAC.1